MTEPLVERRVGMDEVIRRLDRIDGRFDKMDDRFDKIETVLFVGGNQPSHDRRITALETMQGRVSLTSVVALAGVGLDALWNLISKK